MRKLVVSLLAALVVMVPALAVVGPAQAAPAPASAAPAVAAQTTAASADRKKKKRKKSRGAGMRTWERLAQCESGSRWKINTGNGYYGGLQISPSTWRAFGGKRFAGLPHEASKGEQVTVGKRIQKGQGWGAWPSCSRKIGVR